MGTVHDVIVYCQKQIKKDPPPDRLMHYLRKLSRLRITIDDLSDTGIGKTVNQLSRLEGEVGRFAGKIVEAWKAMVENQAQEQAEQEEEEEDEEEEDEEEDDEPQIETKPVIHIHEKVRAKTPDSDDAELEIDTSRRFDSSPENRRDSEEESDVVVHRNHVNHDHNAGHYGNLSIGGGSSPVEMDVNSEDEHPGMKSGSGSSSGSSDSEDENLNIRHRRSSPEHVKIKTESSNMVPYPKIQNGNLKPEVITSLEIPKEHVKRIEERENDRHRHQKDHHHHRKESSRREKDEKPRHRPEESPIKSSTKTEYNHNSSSRESRDKHRSSDKSSETRNHHSETREKKPSSESSSSKDSSRHEKYHKDRSSSSHSRSKDKDRERERERDRDRNRDGHDHRKSHESRKHRDEETKSRSREKDREPKEIKKERDIEDRITPSKHRSGKSEKHHREKREKEEKEVPKLIIPSPTKIKIESSRDSDGNSPRPGSSSSHKRKKERDPSPEPERKEKSHKKQKIMSQLEQNEIDSTCGLNFADVLGCLDKAPVLKPSKKVVTPPKAAPSSSSSSLSKSSSKSNGDSGYKSGTTNGVSKKTESVIPPPKPLPQQKPFKYESYAPPVPTFQPPKPITKYKPIDILPRDDDYANRTNYENSLFKLSNEPVENEYEALSSMMKSRKDRTKVYSGNKTGFVGQMPSLFQMCIRVIQENLDCLGYTGGVPYDILKPAIDRATVKQLDEIEYYNPYLMESTDELWQFHCHREFRGDKPDELETWRDLYSRRKNEQQEKLKNLASKVKKRTELAQPIRKAKLAYVEPSIRGTRFNKTKAATIKNGMKTLKHREEQGIKAGGASYSANNGSKNMVTEEAAITISSDSRAGSAPAPSRERDYSSSASSSSNAFKKPKKAPLMQKTMKLIKSLHRR